MQVGSNKVPLNVPHMRETWILFSSWLSMVQVLMLGVCACSQCLSLKLIGPYNISVEDHQTALELALHNDKLDVVRFLVEHGGADPSARGMFLVNPFIDKIRNNIAFSAEKQQSVLECASEKDYLDIVQLLVEHGVNPNARGMYLENHFHG